jgi:homoserine dehydrogenase
MAVVSDIIEAARRIITFADGGPPPEAFSNIAAAEVASDDEVEHENYLCAHVPNVPGVLGRVASCLGRHGVSIKRMNQDTPGHGEPIDMVILTEPTSEARLRGALAEIDTFDDVLGETHRIRMLEPEPLD